MTQGNLRLQLSCPTPRSPTACSSSRATFPELGQVRIGGTFSVQASFTLPSGEFSIAPRLQGIEVAGLDVDALANARSSCAGPNRRSRITPESWIARAVIAAEDQRFYEHPGYDVAELAKSFERNHDANRVERGASTLSQASREAARHRR